MTDPLIVQHFWRRGWIWCHKKSQIFSNSASIPLPLEGEYGNNLKLIDVIPSAPADLRENFGPGSVEHKNLWMKDSKIAPQGQHPAQEDFVFFW